MQSQTITFFLFVLFFCLLSCGAPRQIEQEPLMTVEEIRKKAHQSSNDSSKNSDDSSSTMPAKVGQEAMTNTDSDTSSDMVETINSDKSTTMAQQVSQQNETIKEAAMSKQEEVMTKVEKTTDKANAMADRAKNTTANVTPTVGERPAYMSQSEFAMLQEINLMRSNPKAYIQQVNEYIEYVNTDAFFDATDRAKEASVAAELIEELKNLEPLSILAPNESLYMVGAKHGKDLQQQGAFGHRGTDGTMPWDRVRKIKNFADGNENLVTGGNTVRQQVVMLLIDSGISGRGHRKNLLDPKWNSVATHEIGEINGVPNSWIQVFGKDTSKKEMPMIEANASEEFAEKTVPFSNEKPAYMIEDEFAMIQEVNLMRSNPKGYIKHVDKYIELVKNDNRLDAAYRSEEISTALELIEELKRLKPLSILAPHQGLYQVATSHGKDVQRQGKIGHRGSDGTMPWDRVRKRTELSDGNENLVGGGETVREQVMILLVDSGITGRGHRRTLLEPKWTNVACYQIGEVGGIPNNWIQVFGSK